MNNVGMKLQNKVGRFSGEKTQAINPINRNYATRPNSFSRLKVKPKYLNFIYEFEETETREKYTARVRELVWSSFVTHPGETFVVMYVSTGVSERDRMDGVGQGAV